MKREIRLLIVLGLFGILHFALFGVVYRSLGASFIIIGAIASCLGYYTPFIIKKYGGYKDGKSNFKDGN